MPQATELLEAHSHTQGPAHYDAEVWILGLVYFRFFYFQ